MVAINIGILLTLAADSVRLLPKRGLPRLLLSAILAVSIGTAVKIGANHLVTIVGSGGDSRDDQHVADLFKAKLAPYLARVSNVPADFHNFDTQLYTCQADEFGYLQWSTYERINPTLLFPVAIITKIAILVGAVRHVLRGGARSPTTAEEPSASRLGADVNFLAIQGLGFWLLAVLVSRLKYVRRFALYADRD
jgi:hypothetical protein